MKTETELKAMTSKEIAKHLEDITQTPICKDKKYCDMVCRIYRDKH